MTIRSQDIKLRPSQVMADVPEGGGGPSNGEIKYGESNTVFDDVSTLDRVVGNVSIRQAHVHVDTPDTDRLLSPYVMVSTLPEDSNVSVVLAECDTFARRSQIATAIANYLIASVPWNGFLLGNHVKDQENIEICQRPGTTIPPIGRTLVLVVNEGMSNEVKEYVRVLEVDPQNRIATDEQGDYPYVSVKCKISSPLSQDWPGTDPNRRFLIGAGKAKIRDTTAANASNYYGASALKATYSLSSLDRKIRVDSVYGQLVPSSATDTPMTDRRPAAQRAVTLAETPRSIVVSAAPHIRRIRVTAESRTNAVAQTLRPLPEPGTITVTYMALGNRQTLTDTGVLEGNVVRFDGAGAGTLDVSTGSLNLTLSAQPDVGSAVLIAWGERLPFTNRSNQGVKVRAPEYVIELMCDGAVIPESVVFTWESGGVLKTATVNASGVISGNATGYVNGISKKAYIKPTAMVDPGGEIQVEFQADSIETEILDAPVLDSMGMGVLALSDEPVPGSLQITWATEQEVTVSSGQYVDRWETVTETTTEVVTEARDEEQFEDDLAMVFTGMAATWAPPSKWAAHS